MDTTEYRPDSRFFDPTSPLPPTECSFKKYQLEPAIFSTTSVLDTEQILNYLETSYSSLRPCSKRPQYEKVVEEFIENLRNAAADTIAVHLRALIPSFPLESLTVKHPTTWWDAVKDRWCPKFLRKYVKIDYKIHKMEAKALYAKMPPLRNGQMYWYIQTLNERV